MLSIDILPIPTDEAVKEIQSRILAVETDVTRWQQKQNSNNNFSAIVPYELEQMRNESKEFLDDLTTRDQRMMLSLIHISGLHLRRVPDGRHAFSGGQLVQQRISFLLPVRGDFQRQHTGRYPFL